MSRAIVLDAGPLGLRFGDMFQAPRKQLLSFDRNRHLVLLEGKIPATKSAESHPQSRAGSPARESFDGLEINLSNRSQIARFCRNLPFAGAVKMYGAV